MVEESWEDDRSCGPQRWPGRPRSRCGGSDAVGIGVRIGVMTVGTGAMIAGTAGKSISRPIGPWFGRRRRSRSRRLSPEPADHARLQNADSYLNLSTVAIISGGSG
jgi:hypothetical protein